MSYVGAGGQTFQSSALARSSLGGGTTTISRGGAGWTQEMENKWLDLYGPRSASTSTPTTNVSSEARKALQAAIAQYEPGGGFGAGVEAGLERGRVQAVSSGMQNLVSSGLANTTQTAGLGKKYEAEVAAPARAQVESVRAERIANLEMMLAQMEQGGYESALNRQFTAEQNALSSITSRQIPVSSSASSPTYTPSVYEPVTETPSVQTGIQLPSLPEQLFSRQGQTVSAATRQSNSGQNWVKMNGEIWVQDENGQWVKAS